MLTHSEPSSLGSALAIRAQPHTLQDWSLQPIDPKVILVARPVKTRRDSASNAKRLLWIDCIAGATVGVFVLLLSGWLSDLYQMPRGFVIFNGIVSLLYGSYSASLAFRHKRPLTQIRFLALANMAWAVLCIAFVTYFWTTASFFGLAHLLAEVIFVGGLGRLEWRWQEELQTR